MHTLKSILLGTTLLVASAAGFAAIVEGRTANDRAYVSGGIGLEESERLKQMADKFSLQLVVSSRQGAYLADTRVTIIGANNQKIFDMQIDAPWLLIDLGPGAYKVMVSHAGMTQERNVTLVQGKREQIAVQFDVPADTAKTPPAPGK